MIKNVIVNFNEKYNQIFFIKTLKIKNKQYKIKIIKKWKKNKRGGEKMQISHKNLEIVRERERERESYILNQVRAKKVSH